MPRETKITCIGCPLGCMVRLSLDDKGEVIDIADNKCKEGQEYVLEEYKCPVRVLTATVLTQNSHQPLLSIRTDKPIAKSMLVQAMSELAQIKVRPSIRIGKVIKTNILGSGANIIATSDLIS